MPARPIAGALVILLWLALATTAAAQPNFPELTGRVVDQADMLDAATEQRLTRMLAAHEEASGEQVVVATLADLQGETLESYGYQLGRHWGIGQQSEDNGALLLVAPSERAVRIEVGYGLEGRLTDARSSQIVNAIILPAFREGQFEAGILEGTGAIVAVLGGDPNAVASRSRGQAEAGAPSIGRTLGYLVLMLAMIGLFGGGGGGKRGRRRRRGWGLPLFIGGGMGGMGGSGGFGGGGFSGGGGGFGGGGASGGW